MTAAGFKVSPRAARCSLDAHRHAASDFRHDGGLRHNHLEDTINDEPGSDGDVGAIAALPTFLAETVLPDAFHFRHLGDSLDLRATRTSEAVMSRRHDRMHSLRGGNSLTSQIQNECGDMLIIKLHEV